MTVEGVLYTEQSPRGPGCECGDVEAVVPPGLWTACVSQALAHIRDS